MIDINFYMKVFELKQRLMKGESFDKEFIFDEFEKFRSKEPVIYNIETTNACNMRCKMCPRTTMMTRKIEALNMETFIKIVDQIRPWTEEEWETWQIFVEEKYGINRNDMSENHFFLHIIPKVVVMHGYGDPLLDKDMSERVKIMAEKGLIPYFSCNPANINIEKNLEMFRNGLGYVKYSIESVDDFLHKKIRGEASNFTESYQKILKLLEEKEKHNYKTIIVITMLDLKGLNQQEEFNKLKKAFEGKDVYIYFKSQDQQWYENKNEGTNSLHWQEFCQFPWSSMTIKSNGEAAMCVEDFNNEIILGDAKEESLQEIWDNEKYIQLRRDHFNLKKCLKCTEQCDMKLIGNMSLKESQGNQIVKNNFSDLKDKVVVIAGATGLIGRGLCKGFMEQGSTIVVTSREDAKGKELEDELNKSCSGKIDYCRLDIAEEESINNLIKFVLEKYSKIDIFINCSWPRTEGWMKNVEEVPYSFIKENLLTHLGGYFLCTQKMALLMKKQKSGSIINFSSIYGIVGPNFSIYEGTEMTCPPAYPLIKGGIVTMTKYFSTYFAKNNVRVNCISPGGIFNNQNEKFVNKYKQLTPLGRMGKPEDIVGSVLFLASDSSSYITGHCLMIDGGWTAW
ncbi:MAG: SDR family oxidoreductase [Candidatus Margulisbacteria bacterium]|nr:SDR family oxidoreductase [Candidatus Margulisiibacteriota bacterium]